MTSGAVATLKCIIAWSGARNLCSLIDDELQARVGEADILRLNADSYVVYTSQATSEIRGWLAPQLRDGESLLVVEFETWSGWGPGINPPWLLRHGH